MARGLSESFKLDEGVNRHGIHTELIFQGDEVIKKQTYDAEPFLKRAAEARAETRGQRWGEMRKLGEIPAHIHAELLKIRDRKEREKAIYAYFRDKPDLVWFERFLIK